MLTLYVNNIRIFYYKARTTPRKSKYSLLLVKSVKMTHVISVPSLPYTFYYVLWDYIDTIKYVTQKYIYFIKLNQHKHLAKHILLCDKNLCVHSVNFYANFVTRQ